MLLRTQILFVAIMAVGSSTAAAEAAPAATTSGAFLSSVFSAQRSELSFLAAQAPSDAARYDISKLNRASVALGPTASAQILSYWSEYQKYVAEETTTAHNDPAYSAAQSALFMRKSLEDAAIGAAITSGPFTVTDFASIAASLASEESMFSLADANGGSAPTGVAATPASTAPASTGGPPASPSSSSSSSRSHAAPSGVLVSAVVVAVGVLAAAMVL